MQKNVLGIMTGTSCDGIDLSYIATDGQEYINYIYFVFVPFSLEVQSHLIDITKKAYQKGKDILSSDEYHLLEQKFTTLVSKAISDNFSDKNIDLIGFHGQTIYHNPSQKITLQMGNPKILSQNHKCDVIYNFRQNDIDHGGQGAPFAPLFHKFLMRKYNSKDQGVFINIGGVGNISYYDPIKDIILGWDTGPGNGLIDILCQKYFDIPYDENGDIAKAGTIFQEVIDEILTHSFFAALPPKSLDRHDFTIDPFLPLSPKDAIATATALTAQSIILSDRFLLSQPKYKIIAGGGAFNRTLMRQIRESSNCPVISAGDAGMKLKSIEADLFAWLAVRSFKKLPLSLPSITGVQSAVSGGEMISYGAI